jgi:hypothetical protein
MARPHAADAMTADDREIELNPRLKSRNNRIYCGCIAAIAVGPRGVTGLCI